MEASINERVIATLGLGADEPTPEDVEPVAQATTEGPEAEEVSDGLAGEDQLAEVGEEDVSPAQPNFEAVTIVSDGKEYTVEDRDEAIRLMQFGKTFTQRNEGLIAREKELEPIRAELTQQRDQYAAVLPELRSFLENAMGPEPTRSDYGDDAAYLVAKDAWNQQRANVEAIRAEQVRVAQEQQAEMQDRTTAWRTDQQRLLLEKLPDWADEQTRKTELNEISEYGRSMGFSDAELAGVFDHRFYLVLRDAWRYRSLDTEGKQKVKEAEVKTAAPNTGGKRETRTRDKDKKQRERLRKTGNPRDAVPLVAARLGL